MSMNLREWASNSTTLQWNFKDEDKYHWKDMKVLGMLWDIFGDQISIPVKDCVAAGVYNKTDTERNCWSV